MKKIIKYVFIISLILSHVFINYSCKNNKNHAVEIGVVLPLTGPVASYGKKAKWGIEFYLKGFNDTSKYEIKAIYEDDKNTPKVSVNSTKKLINVNNVTAIIGSAGSSCSLAMTPITNNNKTVQISPISSSADLTEEGGDYFFRVCPADNAQADEIVDLMIEKNIQEIGIIYTNNDWGMPLAKRIEELFIKSNRTVELFQGVDKNTRDLRTILLKVKEMGISTIASPTYPIEGGNLVKQAKEMGLNVKFFGGDNWDAPEFTNIAGKAAEGVYLVDPKSPNNRLYDKIKNKYKEQFNQSPDINVAFGYDACKALCKSISIMKNNGSQLKNILNDVKFNGASGIIEFDKNGDLKTPSFSRKVIKNGKTLIINKGE